MVPFQFLKTYIGSCCSPAYNLRWISSGTQSGKKMHFFTKAGELYMIWLFSTSLQSPFPTVIEPLWSQDLDFKRWWGPKDSGFLHLIHYFWNVTALLLTFWLFLHFSLGLSLKVWPRSKAFHLSMYHSTPFSHLLLSCIHLITLCNCLFSHCLSIKNAKSCFLITTIYPESTTPWYVVV